MRSAKRGVRFVRFAAPAAAAWVLLAPATAARAEALAIIPLVVGPLQVLLAMLPAILLALGSVLIGMFKPSAVKAAIKVVWHNKLTTVLVAAVVVGAVYGASHLFGGGPAAGAEEIGTAEWLAYRGGIGRRAAALGTADPTDGGTLWAFDSDVKSFYSSPAVLGNRIFVASADYGPLVDRGAIYCLDADNGGVVWKCVPKKFRATYSSPSVGGKYLVCGEGLHQTRDARIVCIDARTGDLLWQVRTASHVESSPCIYNGRAYIGAGDDGFYCVDLAPAPGGKPNVRWHLDGKDYPDCETSPVAHDGRAYFTLGNAGQAVVCVDAETGRLLWRRDAPYPVFGSPAIADGLVFVGMGTGDMVNTAEQLGLEPAGEVWALDPESGEVKWKYRLGATILGAIAAADGRVYFGSRAGDFYCLSTAGEEIAVWNAHEPITTSPAVGRKHVYFLTASGRLYGLDRATFEVAWEVSVGTGRLFASSPAIGRGHIYVGTEQNGLVCVGRPGRRERSWPGHLGGPGRSGWLDGSPLSPVGLFAWRYPRAAAGDDVPEIRAPAAYLERAVEAEGDARKVERGLFVPVAGPKRKGLLKLVLNEQPRRWGEEAWFHPTANPAVRSPAVGRGAAYFVDGRAGDTGRKLHCLDAVSGEARWTREVADDASGELLLRGDYLLACDAGGQVSRIGLSGDQAGRKVWSVAAGEVVGAPAVVEDVVLIVSRSARSVIAVSPVGGEVLWESKLAAEPTSGAIGRRVRAGGTLASSRPAGESEQQERYLVAVGTAEGVALLDMLTGEPVAAVASGPVAGPLASSAKHLAFTTAGGEAVVATWDGRQVARFKGAAPGTPPMLFGSDVLFCTRTTIERGNLATGEATRWLDIEWLGEATAPPIMVASHLYFATRDKGLICARPRK